MENKAIDEVAGERAGALGLENRQGSDGLKPILREFDIVDTEKIKPRDERYQYEEQPAPEAHMRQGERACENASGH
jgi:hypothetical protein